MNPIRARTTITALVVLALLAGTSVAAVDQNQAAAERDAASSLASAPLPDGTTALDGEPAGDAGMLAFAPIVGLPRNVIFRTRFFQSSSPPASVLDYVQAHPPAADAKPISGDGDSTHGNGISFRGFTLPPIPHVLLGRGVIVTVTQLEDGSTGIRADGWAVWTPSRPRGETIPASVRDLTINAGKKKIRVTDPHRVREIAHLFNSLDVFQPPGLVACPVDIPGRPPHPRLTFRTRDGGAVLAYAHIRPGGCARADMVVRGHRYDALGLSGRDGTRLLVLLRRLGALPKSG